MRCKWGIIPTWIYGPHFYYQQFLSSKGQHGYINISLHVSQKLPSQQQEQKHTWANAGDLTSKKLCDPKQVVPPLWTLLSSWAKWQFWSAAPATTRARPADSKGGMSVSFPECSPGTATSTGPVASSLFHPETCLLSLSVLFYEWLQDAVLCPRQQPSHHLRFLPLLYHPHRQHASEPGYLLTISGTCPVFSITTAPTAVQAPVDYRSTLVTSLALCRPSGPAQHCATMLFPKRFLALHLERLRSLEDGALW